MHTFHDSLYLEFAAFCNLPKWQNGQISAKICFNFSAIPLVRSFDWSTMTLYLHALLPTSNLGSMNDEKDLFTWGGKGAAKDSPLHLFLNQAGMELAQWIYATLGSIISLLVAKYILQRQVFPPPEAVDRDQEIRHGMEMQGLIRHLD